VPAHLRETLPRIKSALEGKATDAKEIMAQIEIIPGPGFAWDNSSGSLRQEMPGRTLAAAMLASAGAETGESDANFTQRIASIQARALARRGGLAPVDKSQDCTSG